MLRAESSKADWLFSVGTISLLLGFFGLLGGWVSDAQVAIVGGEVAAILGAALFVGGILLQVSQWIFQERLGFEPHHSTFSKGTEVKFGLKFFLMGLLRWRGFPDLTPDEQQAPLPPLLGLLPGLFMGCLGLPLLLVGVVGFPGKPPEEGDVALDLFFAASGGILCLLALAFLIPAVRDLFRRRS